MMSSGFGLGPGASPHAGSGAGTRARNRRGEGARLRDDILAGAAAILDETGDGQAVTLRAVARRVGISAPSIYPHFADRDAILFALTRAAFAELTDRLQAAQGVDAEDRLISVCNAYLDFAVTHPERYRIMFGGVFDGARAVADGTLTVEEATGLGRDALQVIVESLDACVQSGQSSSTNTFADAVALWLGLHGLAHQRSVVPGFPWPADIAARVIRPLAHLVP
ncbi:TetR/AcrR family transcriptional regulator [Actinoplanes sp. Pm04-4]|uniref:TetR/AcrR family transcriptional regulator n=1 Tax=Paractinoplanes pyxinae TaxID=2997416 RepID=A0ABT4B3W7_9ACTN|nr:TetR/AcrR family transcriptional regulator [Actinoplanes pyxinae]MCY1141203.1 TetR/AcrR family transcriptional regulator [Actinoplanes pyxinae]